MPGGRRRNTGGARTGAGRKLPKAALEWRDYWRGKFNSKPIREWLWRLAKRQAEAGEPMLLCRILDKTFPTPNELSIDGLLKPGMVYRCIDESGKDATPGGGD